MTAHEDIPGSVSANGSPNRRARLPVNADSVGSNACFPPANRYVSGMLSTELSRTALGLAPEDRLELARRLVESVVAPAPLTDAVREGIRRIEDVATGRVVGLTEEQYRAALG